MRLLDRVLRAAVWADGPLAKLVLCHDHDFVTAAIEAKGEVEGRAWVAEAFGCNRKPDDLPGEGGGIECPQCKAYAPECRTPGHGRWLVGLPKPGLCFRTDACPLCVWSWSDSYAAPGTVERFLYEVQSAYYWGREFREMSLRIGPNPPALLIEAVEFFGNEVRRRENWEAEIRAREREQKARPKP